MIPIDMGRGMSRALGNMSKFDYIAESISLERLMGFVDGMQENSAKGRFRSPIEPMILWGMRDKLEERAGEVDNVNLTNYFGAYVNGYLFDASVSKRLLDIMGKEKTKYSCAMSHLKIPFRKDGKRFRTKDNIYKCLDESRLLVYDDRNFDNFEPRFRSKIKN